MSGGWVLLAPERVETVRKLIVEASVEIHTITSDVRCALALVGSGQAAGLAVVSYALLSPMVVELVTDRYGSRRPRILPGELGGRRPAITPESVSRRPQWADGPAVDPRAR